MLNKSMVGSFLIVGALTSIYAYAQADIHQGLLNLSQNFENPTITEQLYLGASYSNSPSINLYNLPLQTANDKPVTSLNNGRKSAIGFAFDSNDKLYVSDISAMDTGYFYVYTLPLTSQSTMDYAVRSRAASGIAVHPTLNQLFVTSEYAATIKVYNLPIVNAETLPALTLNLSTTEPAPKYPAQMIIDADTGVVRAAACNTDNKGGFVQFTPPFKDGQFSDDIPGTFNKDNGCAKGIAMNKAKTKLYLGTTWSEILIFDMATQTFDTPIKVEKSRFANLAVDSNDNLYAVDSDLKKVYMFAAPVASGAVPTLTLDVSSNNNYPNGLAIK